MINKNKKKNKKKKKKMNKKKKNIRKSKNKKKVKSTHLLLNLFLLMHPIPKKAQLNKNKVTAKKDYFLYSCIVLHL